MPYKEHVENLIDDEKYRDEITFFSLDQELGQVMRCSVEGCVALEGDVAV